MFFIRPAEVVQETELTWVVMMRECEYFLKVRYSDSSMYQENPALWLIWPSSVVLSTSRLGDAVLFITIMLTKAVWAFWCCVELRLLAPATALLTLHHPVRCILYTAGSAQLNWRWWAKSRIRNFYKHIWGMLSYLASLPGSCLDSSRFIPCPLFHFIQGTTRGGLSFNFDFMLDDLHLAGLPRQEGDGCGAPSSYRPEIIAFLGRHELDVEHCFWLEYCLFVVLLVWFGRSWAIALLCSRGLPFSGAICWYGKSRHWLCCKVGLT